MAVLIVIASIYLLTSKPVKENSNSIECLTGKVALYVQSGCPACEKQKSTLGDDYNKLNSIDCYFEREKCSGIQYIPTWKINDQLYVGIKTIEEVNEIAGC